MVQTKYALNGGLEVNVNIVYVKKYILENYTLIANCMNNSVEKESPHYLLMRFKRKAVHT